MIVIRGLVVSVGYDDLLAVTLPLNMRHMRECWVVTTLEDTATHRAACSISGVKLHITDAFTRPDANGVRPAFNKGLAAEECLEVMGRHGWICSWDADTIFPDELPTSLARSGRIHGLHRLVLDDVRAYRGPESWRLARRQHDDPAVGYFQLFDADDPAIKDARPWFDPTFAHAGGTDEYLASHWPRSRRVMLPGTCLHLGPVATNWYGRASERMDGAEVPEAGERLRAMDSLIKRHDWYWARPGLDMAKLTDEVEPPHRLDVEGCKPTGFEIPFIRSAGRRKVR